MKAKTSGRQSKTAGVAMTPDFKAAVMARVESLRPRVSSFSNYFQQLASLDLEQGLLGPSLVGKRVLAAVR